MSIDLEHLRLTIHTSLATTGRAPATSALAAARDLALDADGRIVLAHPFATVTGRLERGCVRHEPSAAHAYLREAGLSGSFWGL